MLGRQRHRVGIRKLLLLDLPRQIHCLISFEEAPLGTLQLERARDSKRKRQEYDEIKKRQKIEEKELANMQVDREITKLDAQVEESREARDPKRREVLQHEVQLDLTTKADIRRSQQIQPPKQQVLTADMNLSDSSSSDDDSD